MRTGTELKKAIEVVAIRLMDGGLSVNQKACLSGMCVALNWVLNDNPELGTTLQRLLDGEEPIKKGKSE